MRFEANGTKGAKNHIALFSFRSLFVKRGRIHAKAIFCPYEREKDDESSCISTTPDYVVRFSHHPDNRVALFIQSSPGSSGDNARTADIASQQEEGGTNGHHKRKKGEKGEKAAAKA